MKSFKFLFVIQYFIFALCVNLIFAIPPAKAKLMQECLCRDHEIIPAGNALPYLGGRQSPGDSIGMTYKDMHEHTHGKRIMVDDYGQAHINWMWLDSSLTTRYCAWNARYVNGSYFGKIQASASYSGYVQIDVTPNDQRSVIAYNELDTISGAWWSYIDIDTASLGGGFPNDPKGPHVADHIWPYIAVANNGNIVMATGDYSSDFGLDHLYLTTDYGNTWIYQYAFDSCVNPSHFVIASPYSDKVAFFHTRFITDSVASGQLDHDVWCMISIDGGTTWGAHTNITDYQPYPNDSVRAYAGVDAAFDISDNLHIVWEGRKVTDNYYQASKIFHWDEVNDTITIVNSPSIYYNDPGGWWITIPGAGDPGCWRMPADRPQVIIDRDVTGHLYCLWHGNDDYYDYCSHGRFNEELFGSYSTDNGTTWSDYVNLTNTRSPGAGPGDCMSEDFMTANPSVVNDSIFLVYIEDKDAGHMPCWGEWTENPVRCWVFHKNLITGIEEGKSKAIKSNNQRATIISGPLLLPEDKNWKVFDITGRQIQALNPAPGIYFIKVDGKTQQKVVKIK